MGYIKLGNDILKALCLFRKQQAQVLLYLIRHTEGYQKQICTFTLSKASAWCMLQPHHLTKELAELNQLGFVHILSKRPYIVVFDMRKFEDINAH